MRHPFAHPQLHPAHREPKMGRELSLGQPRLRARTKREAEDGCAHQEPTYAAFGSPD